MLEPACGPCVGMGQAPPSGANSLRTFNRNFPGRSGTADDQVYLCSPAVAAVSMLKGEIADPAHPPSGCYFHPRCPYAVERCRVEPPALRSLGPDHEARCHRAEELTLQGVREGTERPQPVPVS